MHHDNTIRKHLGSYKNYKHIDLYGEELIIINDMFNYRRHGILDAKIIYDDYHMSRYMEYQIFLSCGKCGIQLFTFKDKHKGMLLHFNDLSKAYMSCEEIIMVEALG